MNDYFGDEEFKPKYPEENFRRMYRMSSTLFNKIVNKIISYDVKPIPEYFTYFTQRYDATGRLSIGPIMKCTSAIRQLAYGTVPDAFDESLQIVERASRESSECSFVVNRHTYRKGYYLADDIYPAWSTFVKSFSVAGDEKSLKFKRVQKAARNILNELSKYSKENDTTGPNTLIVKERNFIGNDVVKRYSLVIPTWHVLSPFRLHATTPGCLDELVKIIECQKKIPEQTAYPVFIDVEPTQVRNQNRPVGEAFSKHENHEAAGK
nr:Toll/interleukin-1 receptor (TIR) domain-containing protein [Tanacetum cinerariifolium]